MWVGRQRWAEDLLHLAVKGLRSQRCKRSAIVGAALQRPSTNRKVIEGSIAMPRAYRWRRQRERRGLQHKTTANVRCICFSQPATNIGAYCARRTPLQPPSVRARIQPRTSAASVAIATAGLGELHLHAYIFLASRRCSRSYALPSSPPCECSTT